MVRRAISAGLPSGTVTFLFTDIEGSTRLLRELDDRYEQVRSEHDGLLRSAASAHGGEEVDSQGDSIFFSFRRARDAVAAAADAQRALVAHQWPDAAALRVRMALHSGEPSVGEDGRYVGLAVHRAARIASLARGGQVLLSSTTAGLAADSLPAGVRLRDFGRHALKDFDQPERVSQLVIDGLPTEFPRVRTRQDRRRRRRLALLAVLVAAGGAAAGAVLATGGSSKPEPVTVVPNSVAVIDPGTDRVVADTPVGTAPLVVAGDEGVWTANTGDGTLTRIDPKTYEARTYGFAGPIGGIGLGLGSVWATNPLNGTLVPVDPVYGHPGNPILVSRPKRHGVASDYNGNVGAVAVGFGSIWVAVDVPTSEVARIDPATGKVIATIDDVYGGSLAIGDGAVWATSMGDVTVKQIDPGINAVLKSFPAPYQSDEAAAPITVAYGKAWAPVAFQDLLPAIPTSDASGAALTVHVGGYPTGVAAGAGAIWVANNHDGTVSKVDPKRGTVVQTITVGHSPYSIAFGSGRVWVAVRAP